jgi:phospholipid/cholesterol/gamma-HCH transport system substrate-binding protein
VNLTRAQKIRLGTFVVSGVTVVAGSMVVLAGLRTWEPRDEYTVHFTGNVGGLEPSAPVKYQGLRLGRVETMRIAPDAPEAIEVVLSVPSGTVLYQGTKAVLDASGLTGLKTINLTPGDPREGRIEPGSRLPSDDSLIDRISGRAEEIAIKIEMAANQVVRWTSDDNRKRTERLIDSTTKLAESLDLFLSTNREPFGRAMNGIANASGAITELAQEGDNSIEIVRADINKTLEEARVTIKAYREPISGIDPQEVKATLNAARSALTSLDTRLSDAQLGDTITQLGLALKDVTRLLQSTDLILRAGRDDFVATLKYLRQAAEDLREFSRIIAQNPSALISGRE